MKAQLDDLLGPSTARSDDAARRAVDDYHLREPEANWAGSGVAYNSDIVASAERAGISPSRIEEILRTDKPNRPDPSSYMSREAIENHLRLFEDGAVRIQPSPQVGQVGRNETWVMPRSLVDDAVRQAAGDPRKLEALLGLDNGYLGNAPVLIDIPTPRNARIPSGNEYGANEFWRPGGYTHPGGIPEAVIDPVPAGSYTSRPVF